MQFNLIYQGDLPPNGNAAVKWQIRRKFDDQIRRLWDYPPLSDIDEYRDKDYRPNDCYLGRFVQNVEFISFVSEKIATLVELDILLLSAGMGPRIVTRGGDIDNRLKTLLDALKAPGDNGQEMPLCPDVPPDGRVYCLMDDDKLVSRLNIKVDRLLTVDNYSNNAFVVINIKITAGRGLTCNMGIAI